MPSVAVQSKFCALGSILLIWYVKVSTSPEVGLTAHMNSYWLLRINLGLLDWVQCGHRIRGHRKLCPQLNEFIWHDLWYHQWLCEKKWMKIKRKIKKKRGWGGAGNAHMLLLAMREIGTEWKRPMVFKAQNIFFCICYDLKGTYACPEPAVQVIVQV